MTRKFVKPKTNQMLPKPNVKRKSGGQPGNLNAFKHGFYSRRFTKLELRHLNVILANDLTDEIALTRVLLRRYFYLANNQANSLDEWSTIINICGTIATRLSGLVRTQYMLTGDNPDPFLSLLKQAAQINGLGQGYFADV